MRKYMYCAVYFLCGLTLLNVVVYHFLSDFPQEKSGMVFNAGEIIQGEVVARKFVLRNDTDTSVVIEKIQHSCSCLVSDISEGDTVAPHTEYSFSLSMDTKGYSGKVSNKVLLVTNSNTTKYHVFGIDCNVTVPFIITPKELYFPNVIQGIQDERDVVLKNTMKRNITITDVKPSVDYLVCTFVLDADKWIIRIAVAADAPLGSHEAAIDVFTSLSEIPAITIPVSCNITSEIICEPATIAFGYVTRKNQTKICGEIYAKTDTSVRFVDAIATTDDVVVSASATKQNDPSNIGTFCVQISENATKGQAITTSVRICTTSQRTPIIVVPVSFFIGSEYADY